jgi:hypothetical protein
MSAPVPQPRNEGVLPWVAAAPQPLLTVTGHIAVITPVRFVWRGTYCGWCHQYAPLWTDGGTIELGITVGLPHRRAQQTTPHWYQLYRPAAVPTVPADCPNPACHRPATQTIAGREVPTGWLNGTWRLAIGPFPVGDDRDDRCPSPVHPDTYRLVDQARSAMRSTHPDLVAAADAYTARQRRRAARG